MLRRSLRGNVDRNWKRLRKNTDQKVVPYVGTWIEMSLIGWSGIIGRSRSLRGNVDRNFNWL